MLIPEATRANPLPIKGVILIVISYEGSAIYRISRSFLVIVWLIVIGQHRRLHYSKEKFDG